MRKISNKRMTGGTVFGVLLAACMISGVPHMAHAAQGGACPAGSGPKTFQIGAGVIVKVMPLMGCLDGTRLDAAHSPVIEFVKDGTVLFRQVGGQWLTVTDVQSVGTGNDYKVYLRAWNGGNGVNAGTTYVYTVDASTGAVTRIGAQNYCRGEGCDQSFWKKFVVAKPVI